MVVTRGVREVAVGPDQVHLHCLLVVHLLYQAREAMEWAPVRSAAMLSGKGEARKIVDLP
jgi:hypothetical protein